MVNHVGLLAGAVVISADKSTLAFTIRVINCGQTIFYQLAGADLVGVEGGGEVINYICHGKIMP